jgi:hypothetical protein
MLPFLQLSLFCVEPVYIYIVTYWVYVTRQLTSRRIQYNEFTALALTFTPFTILQVLPSTVSRLLIL